MAGLFGKLPAHGDFVARGWPEPVRDAVDGWLTGGMLLLRNGAQDEAAFAERMCAAPVWYAYVPPGLLTPLALHIVLAASIDRAGRWFPIVGGMAGAAAAVWARAGALPALAAAIMAGRAGAVDADGLVTLLTAAIGDADVVAAKPPVTARWWCGGDAAMIDGPTVDAALLGRLLCEGCAR